MLHFQAGAAETKRHPLMGGQGSEGLTSWGGPGRSGPARAAAQTKKLLTPPLPSLDEEVLVRTRWPAFAFESTCGGGGVVGG